MLHALIMIVGVCVFIDDIGSKVLRRTRFEG